MKTKVRKVRNHRDLEKRLAGIALWRVTGPCVVTGKRVSRIFDGTREAAIDCLKQGDNHV